MKSIILLLLFGNVDISDGDSVTLGGEDVTFGGEEVVW